MNREESLLSFLQQVGWQKAKRVLLAADASFRSYERLTNETGQTAVLMNAPPPENPGQFIFIDRLLEQAGIRVPRILASDLSNGFVLLEDFGDNTFARLLDRGTSVRDLYARAVDTLTQMQKKIDLSNDGIPAYDFDKMMFEVSLLPDWFGKYAVPGGLSEQSRNEFMALWEPLIRQIQTLPKTLVLLDFHIDNLMITPDEVCGVLDFQDGRIGPAVYDLMSLVEDERRDVSEEIRREMIERYFDARPEVNQPFVRKALDLVAMQRHTKVVGIFVRLCVRDGKDRYLKMIPFVWSLIERHLNQPEFEAYRNWIDKNIPDKLRHIIPQVKKCV